MSNCSNFIDLAAATCGVDVGFGKVILLFKEKTSVSLSSLNANSINADIEAGGIVGVLKNWHTVAGAPVAEINVERPGSAEMKLIRPEILADVLTFEGNIGNRDVIDSLVKVGTVHGLVIDDMGNVFGERVNYAINTIGTMPLNFSGKTSTSLQSDNASDKTVAVTVRYLVKDLAMLAANVEVEDVASKVKVDGQLVSGVVTSATAASLAIKLTDKYTQAAFDVALLAADIEVRTDSKTATVSTATYVDGVLTLSLTGTAFAPAGITNFYVKISADNCYMKETKFTVYET